MNAETPTPHYEAPKAQDPLDEALEMQHAAQAARRQSGFEEYESDELMPQQEQAPFDEENYIEYESNPATVTKESTPSSRFTTRDKIFAGVGIVAGGLTAGVAVAENVAPSEVVYSTTATVTAGNGVESAVDEAIGFLGENGANPADATERQDVISQAVDIMSDENGHVQPGESVQVVVEKSPVFGNETYKAIPNDTETNE